MPTERLMIMDFVVWLANDTSYRQDEHITFIVDSLKPIAGQIDLNG